MLKEVIIGLLSILTRLYAWASIPLQLVRLWPLLLRARTVMMVAEGGFGFTLLCPDFLRRRYPPEDGLVVFAVYPGRHNLMVDRLEGCWPQIVRWSMFPIFPGGVCVPDAALALRIFDVVAVILRRIWPDKLVFELQDISRLYPPQIPVRRNAYFETRLERTFFETITRDPAPTVHLPRELRDPVARALRERGGTDFSRRCTLYVRLKGDARGADKSSFRRSGSPLPDYFPAIDFLNAQGYQVWLTGDHRLDDAMRRRFGGGLVDHESLGVESDLFAVYAGTECDMLVGQQAGGAHYTHVNSVPFLTVNGFPFGACLPFATVFYKTLRDRDARLIDARRLLTEFAFDFDCEGYELLDNDAAEIELAVRDFVLGGGAARGYGLTPVQAGIPDAVESIDLGCARLSPAWVSRLAISG